MDYKKHYDKLIITRLLLKQDRINLKKQNIYFEGHHIVPKSLGGQGNSYNYSHPNIVLLTAREHFIAHWLLIKFNPCKQNIAAFWKMCISKNTPERYHSSKGYEEARLLFSKDMKGNKNALGNNTSKSNTENMKWTDDKRQKYKLKTTGMKKQGNYKGNTFFQNKTRPEISEIMSKKVLEVKTELIFLSKKECIEKLDIKNNFQFYKKLQNKELIYL